MTVLTPLPGLLKAHNIDPHGVVHVGAHEAQELPVYQQCGFRRVLWVEANPALAARLRDRGLEVAECAVVRRPRPVTLHVTSWDQQSSVLQPVKYRVVDTVQVDGRRLDQLDTTGCNVLVVDVQGAELSVLRSGALLAWDMLVVECSRVPRYHRQPSMPQIVEWCTRHGYRVVAELAHGKGRVVDLVMVRG